MDMRVRLASCIGESDTNNVQVSQTAGMEIGVRQESCEWMRSNRVWMRSSRVVDEI